MKRVLFVVCPCCGRNRIVIGGKLDWVDYDPKTMEFINVREGGGKTGTGKKGRGQGTGVGFPKIASLTLSDAVKAGGAELGFAQQIATRVEKVTREFKRTGLIP